ncbi:MAG: hypothetical protein ACM3SX_01830 [Deltaproteobacteria bacterium]
MRNRRILGYVIVLVGILMYRRAQLGPTHSRLGTGVGVAFMLIGLVYVVLQRRRSLA